MGLFIVFCNKEQVNVLSDAHVYH